MIVVQFILHIEDLQQKINKIRKLVIQFLIRQFL